LSTCEEIELVGSEKESNFEISREDYTNFSPYGIMIYAWGEKNN
jgi:hypothetical protein